MFALEVFAESFEGCGAGLGEIDGGFVFCEIHRCVSDAPDDRLDQDGQEVDPFFGEAVGYFLFVCVFRVFGPCQYPFFFQQGEPVSEDVGGDAFFGLPEELVEMTTLVEDDIPEYQDRPFIPDDLDEEVYGAI